MKYENHVSRCHLAGLIQDLVPPDPRLHFHKFGLHELVVSLGSLAFLCEDYGSERRNTAADNSALLPCEIADQEGISDPSRQCPVDPRQADIQLRCSLHENGEAISDTVTVCLNRNQLTGYHDVYPGIDAPRYHRVKHRNTYSRGSKSPIFGKHSAYCCSLRRYAGKSCEFRLRRHLKCLVAASVMEGSSTEECWYAELTKLMSGFKFGRKCDNEEFAKPAVKSLFRRHRQRRRKWHARQHDRIKVPIIVHIDTFLRFQTPNWRYKQCSNLVLRSEIFMAGLLFAKSQLDITPRNSSVNGYVDMFYARESPLTEQNEVCNIHSCCCSPAQRRVCASHLTRICEDLKRIISFIYRNNSLINMSHMGPYRYLMYFYLQVLAFSGSIAIERCAEGIPRAILTVGVVQVDKFVSANRCTAFSTLHMMLHSGGKRTQLSHAPGWLSDRYSSDRTLSPGCANMSKLERLFATDDQRYRNRVWRRRVGSIYLGQGCEENTIRRIVRMTHIIDNAPVCGMPTVLGFIQAPAFYRDQYMICPMMAETLSINSRMFVPGGGLSFFPEPPDISFLKCLLSTPLYSVSSAPGTLDTFDVTGSRGRIGYRKINELVWRYQRLMSLSGSALSTFLRFVDWSSPTECYAAIRAMYAWQEPCLGTLLELVSRDFAPPHVPKEVQEYACDLLIRKYTTKKLVRFLPQLVVAPGSRRVIHHLIEACRTDHEIAIRMYWALESWDKPITRPSHEMTHFLGVIQAGGESQGVFHAIKSQRLLRQRLNFLMQQLKSTSHGHTGRSATLAGALQSEDVRELFHGLGTCMGSDANVRFNVQLPLFSNPSFWIRSIDTGRCSVVKTSHDPLLLAFYVSDIAAAQQGLDSASSLAEHTGTKISSQREGHLHMRYVMFKNSDDLRLDQLCQQIVKVADVLLRRHGVESYIKSYEVTPTSSRDGFVEFLMETKSLSAVMADHGSVEAYVLGDNPSLVDALTKRLNFVGSLASYSALTYLLGIGDRHNDNLIVSRSGHVVHVDYGYVLGSDPKPFSAPPFKLSPELLEFLGGHNSYFYHRFKERFYLVFTILRRHAKLIIMLLYILVDSNLKNVNLSAMVEMESKFMLTEHRDYDLRQHVNSLVETSASAWTATLSEKWHKFAMRWT
ncbi:phosphatidylinositol 3-and 4-kinase domain containing protein, putative [Babesia bigemina]|uniref:Phosphatidylinositol 3-and 4-kinase domain containing protein, putative n=1 Tax=Babesia bigemina TaxID=5866 RepID=A0A061D3X1_BABBI|nr:phosphatidylinositol 3-and 4-kinase domain containing protein, putative [Babesia bigemina]CDR95416.1 phosphatidylinositol 3-and 4-kinase domain containing protein, putative [Babesia bigemina]|eukprot:XP_012767602.1 phosphatidylinositol 3-and 4-kinase domain containing protein, putative [Babesia bigemina]